MNLNTEQLASLQDASRPLVQWMKDNCHPHCKAIVDNEQAEVLEGLAATASNVTVRRRSSALIAGEPAIKHALASHFSKLIERWNDGENIQGMMEADEFWDKHLEPIAANA